MGLSENEVYPITIHHAYFGGTMKPWHWHVLHTCGVLPQSPSFTHVTVMDIVAQWWRQPLAVTWNPWDSRLTPSQTKSNFKLFRKPSIFGLCLFLTIHQNLLSFLPNGTHLGERFMLFLDFLEPSIPKGLRRKIRGLRICSPSVDDSTAWLVPQYQVVSLDYKPVQWNWEEVKIQWWNCAKYERWCTMM